MANVLVVTTVEQPERHLHQYIEESDAIKVVTPIVRQGLLDWLANDQRAFTRASEVADSVAERLPGETVDTAPGESDVGLAIRDALATFPADRIIVALRPDEEAGVVETIAGASTPERSVDGVPVRTVVISEG